MDSGQDAIQIDTVTNEKDLGVIVDQALILVNTSQRKSVKQTGIWVLFLEILLTWMKKYP